MMGRCELVDLQLDFNVEQMYHRRKKEKPRKKPCEMKQQRIRGRSKKADMELEFRKE